ncbi:MAG: sigma-70 family RNA polymerase sigma factor [Patescibacteria group bacterium]
MAFPQWPKNRTEQKENAGFPEELFQLVGSDDREAVTNAVNRLVLLLADLPRTERSLAKSDRELVIPLESAEQKEAILDALYDLSIFPWEEHGQLIIEHKSDIAKLRAAGFEDKGLQVISMPSPDSGLLGPNSPDPAFPMQYPQSLSDDLRDRFASGKAAVAAEQRTRTPQVDESEIEPGADTELNDIINRFDSGQIEEDDPDFRRRVGYLPSLRLFPHQYVWEKGKVTDKRSGEEISKEQMKALYQKAKEGDPEAMTSLVRMHTGLVLKVVSRYTQKFGGDPDDLFQEGMMGLMRAVQLKDEREGSFSTYAILHIESRIRRTGYEDKNVIHRPAHVAQQASELRRAKELVSRDGELRPKDVFAELPNHRGSFGGKEIPDTGTALDRLERRYYLNALFDPVSIAEDNVIDKEYVPHGVLDDTSVNPETLAWHADLRSEIAKGLLTLTPREEQVIRLRFGISEASATSKDRIIDIQGYLSAAQDAYTGERTLEEVGILFDITRERVRQIEAKGLRKLKHPSRTRALRWFLEYRDEKSKRYAPSNY